MVAAPQPPFVGTQPAETAESASRRARDPETRRAAARRRLEERAGLSSERVAHFRRPSERPFTAQERGRVTILFGGLTTKHERLIQAVFESCGHPARALPQPDLASCHVGKQYCDNGICNPAYFTIGSLIRYLQQLESEGLSRQEVVDRYVFFTAGSCGPCRFGMYEAQYRLALRNAGFDGFRVLLFQQNHGWGADTGEPGLKLSLHLGLGAVNAINAADALQAFGYEARPYEVVPGTVDRRLDLSLEAAAAVLAGRRRLEALEGAPAWMYRLVGAKTLTPLVNARAQLYGEAARRLVDACRDPLGGIEVDRLRVKPVVKVTGEFWAQTTEGDGNFRMLAFLESEGAHVLVEPLGGWLLYLLEHTRERALERRGLNLPRTGSIGARLRAALKDDRRLAVRLLLLAIGERMYRQQYDRLRHALALPDALLDQRALARLARPYYRSLARGGEGHLEVAKHIYYTTERKAHMVLSLKPFGCMPSTQSDGVQSAIVARYKDTIFVPVETGAEGELGAHSRVQMALVDARARARSEFDRALASTGRSLEEIRAFVDAHPRLRTAAYRVPHRRGIAGIAANFVLHVGDLMRRRTRGHGAQVSGPAAAQGA